MLVISPMMLTGTGAPTLLQQVAVGVVWTAPVTIVVSLIGMLVCFAQKMPRAAPIFSLVPLLWFVALIGFFIFLAAVTSG